MKKQQYSRRLCLRIDGVPSVNRETSNDVLEKVKEICAESNLEIPDLNQQSWPKYMRQTSVLV